MKLRGQIDIRHFFKFKTENATNAMVKLVTCIHFEAKVLAGRGMERRGWMFHSVWSTSV